MLASGFYTPHMVGLLHVWADACPELQERLSFQDYTQSACWFYSTQIFAFCPSQPNKVMGQ